MAARPSRGLGKGLDSLIPDAVSEAKAKKGTAKEEILPEDKGTQETMVKITMVEPNRKQPRKNFDEDSLQELSDSIRQVGLIQPILVQDRKDHYEIIAGERRWRASKMAGLKEIPVIIRDYTEQEIMEISLIENIQREDLNPIEEAQAYKRLLTEFNLKQDEVAERVAKVEKLVKNLHKPEKQKQKKDNQTIQVIYQDIEEKLKQKLSTKVIVTPKGEGSGKIEIEFYNHEDLDRLLDILGNN